MIRLLRFLFTGICHLHKWEIHDTYTLYRTTTAKEEGEMPTGRRYVLKCSCCGDMKSVNVDR